VTLSTWWLSYLDNTKQCTCISILFTWCIWN